MNHANTATEFVVLTARSGSFFLGAKLLYKAVCISFNSLRQAVIYSVICIPVFWPNSQQYINAKKIL